MWYKQITIGLFAILLSATAEAVEHVKISYNLPIKPMPAVYRVTIAIVTADNPEWIVRTLISGAVREVTVHNNGLYRAG